MRHVEEYRRFAGDPRAPRPDRRGGHAPVGDDGGVRRPDALDPQVRARRAAAARNPPAARTWLPGVRHAAREDRPRARARRHARRDLLLVRRHVARAGDARATCSARRPAAPTCASCTRRSTRWVSRGGSRTRQRRVLRRRLRDDRAGERDGGARSGARRARQLLAARGARAGAARRRRAPLGAGVQDRRRCSRRGMSAS